jgi:integrase
MLNTQIAESQLHHPVLGGKAYVFKRDDSQFWQAATYINGHSYRHSTKEAQLHDAVEFAENWYMTLWGKASIGALEPPKGSKEPLEKTISQWSEIFLNEYAVMTNGQRSDKWIKSHEIRLRLHILPFMGHLHPSQITTSVCQKYRLMRSAVPEKKNPRAKDKRVFKAKPPARKTIHNEFVTLRLMLKCIERHGAMISFPNLDAPYRGNGKVSHRPWFSPAEYKELYKATGKYKKEALPHVRWCAEQVHDFVLLMANTGLRPDEATNLQHRDIEIVHDEDSDETILVIEVRGKRGVGYCKSTTNAVKPYLRLLNRPRPAYLNEDGEELEEAQAGEKKVVLPQPEDPVFPSNHIKLFNSLLHRKKLKFDRDNQPRTAYSLRHSYICFRLMEGADVYQLAKNCRTSVEMIEKHYAAHIKNMLDAGLINTRKSRKTIKNKATLSKDSPASAYQDDDED